jgi:hypothetical protein
MFVAESFLIGSANDRRAAIIEKSPEGIDIYESGTNYIIGTNHFQSEILGKSQMNLDHIKTSASLYRYQRVQELLDKNGKNSVLKTSRILRDRSGANDKSIGLGNEKSINQLIAHHGIIFQPEKKLVWISTAPWQLGKFVCYDLNKVFSLDMNENKEIYEEDLVIPPDPFLFSEDFKNAGKFNRYRFPFQSKEGLEPDSLIKWNPDSYLSYMLAADFCFQNKNYDKAALLYREGLTKEIATVQEREHMKKNLELCN